MNARFDLTGKTFGRLTVLSFAGIAARKRAYTWLCQCACGKTKTVISHCLRSGHTRSCGCLSRDVCIERSTIHGMTHTPEFRIWKAMISRCTNPKVKSYRDYGARGITVCDRWKNDFAAFHQDMGNRPSPELTLERVDNERGYEPDNVIWATRLSQNRNRRKRRWAKRPASYA